MAAEDIQRVYRCYVVKEMEGQMESFERLGASYIIKAVNIIETPEDPGKCIRVRMSTGC